MNTLKNYSPLLLSIFLFLLASCDAIIPKSLNNEGDVEKINQQFINETKVHGYDVENLPVVRIQYSQQQQLKNTVGSVGLNYIADDKVSNVFSYLGQNRTNESFPIVLYTDSLLYRKPMKFNEFDFSSILPNINKAVKLIEKQIPDYSFEALSRYSLLASKNNKGEEHIFILQFVKKTEGKKLEIRAITSRYYEIECTVIDNELSFNLK